MFTGFHRGLARESAHFGVLIFSCYMGCGGSALEAGKALGRSGDGGVDDCALSLGHGSLKCDVWLTQPTQRTTTMSQVIKAVLVSVAALFTFVAVKIALLVGLVYAVFVIASRMH